MAILVNVVVISIQWSMLMAVPLLRSVTGSPDADVVAVAGFLDTTPGRRIVSSPIFLSSRLALATKSAASVPSGPRGR